MAASSEANEARCEPKITSATSGEAKVAIELVKSASTEATRVSDDPTIASNEANSASIFS